MSGKKLIISAVPKAGFWRCGRHFTHAGTPVSKGDFDDTQWARLEAEPKLRIKPATAEDLASAEDRAFQIKEAITSLTAGDFQQDGKPKMDALKALLHDGLGKIPATERDAVWADMLAANFEAPKASE
ncbi:HI1506-related protein [Aliiroseovarius lamellibrachiae]|uniref:HI1506-related protein n=1 Tax=Aliiroseovarius lamellibrachiae TaxID=1924933 RepID=UPI001BDFBB7C|nr:HI1506-related protein [Aliiroseovarius lamellibrachiae]MBT2131220.1 hypothetical protein [Aliiroseovarius lamellibrachiae]